MIAWDQIGLTTVFLTSDIEVAGEDASVEEVSEEKEATVEAGENADAETENGDEVSEEKATEGEVGEAGEGMEGMAEGDIGGMMNGEVQTPKDPLLSNPIAFGGISVAVFIVGGILGLLLAKKKIKKGIELYEDI